MRHRLLLKTIAALLGLELVSWLSYGASGTFDTIAFSVVVASVLLLSLYKLEYGIYAVVAELVVGSHGYLLSVTFGNFVISLRLAFFLVLILAWFVWVARDKAVYFFSSQLWKWYVALCTFLVIGMIVGYINGNSTHNIFFDWNGYLFFGMILPFTQAIRSQQQVYNIIIVMCAGVVVLALQTVLLVFLFSHSQYFVYYLSSLYNWIRDFRIGEITLQPNGFYRIFFQSHIYVVYTLFLSLALVLYRWRWQYIALLGTTITLLFLSYSRSFWLATSLVVIICTGYMLWKQQVGLRNLITTYCLMVGLFAIGYVGIVGIVNLPLPSDAGSNVSAGNLLTDRTQDPTTEAAGSSRMALLKPLLQKNIEHPLLGSGFGTTVTYRTQDPRALATNPDGNYTTFAFEWGYLDLWLKLGIAGTGLFIIILWLLVTQGYELARSIPESTDRFLIIGITLGLLALALVHGLTPYLNHPLGIGWIIMATVIFDFYLKHTHEAPIG